MIKRYRGTRYSVKKTTNGLYQGQLYLKGFIVTEDIESSHKRKEVIALTKSYIDYLLL